ncbi:hypothetical protein PMAYCL1PPCAC_00195, partial [Pristionchus mayeri]
IKYRTFIHAKMLRILLLCETLHLALASCQPGNALECASENNGIFGVVSYWANGFRWSYVYIYVCATITGMILCKTMMRHSTRR